MHFSGIRDVICKSREIWIWVQQAQKTPNKTGYVGFFMLKVG